MNYLRNCWYVAGHGEEAGPKPFARTYLGEPVVIYRTDAGRIVAMDNRCPHRFAPLDKGTVVGELIQCPYHGLRFDPSGKCVGLPAGGVAPSSTQRRTYSIVERHSLLWIWMGDGAAADPATIPDFSYLESPDYGWFSGYLYAKANYQLLVDNLLDLTHAEFLHPLLKSDGWAGRNEQTVTREGDTISIYNRADDDHILPIMQRMDASLPPIGTTIQHERWNAPGVIRLSVEFYSGDQQIIIPSGHFLTPESPTSTHYLVRGGQGVHPDNAGFTAGMREGVLNVFRSEDIPIVEAQQQFIGDDRDLMDLRPAMFKSDSGAVQARRLLAKRIQQEQESAGVPSGTLASAVG